MMNRIKNFVLGAVMAIGVMAASLTAMAGTQYVQTNMNFRSGSSISTSIIGSVPAGAQVEVLGSQNGWDLIIYNGVTGYICGGNLADSFSSSSKSAGQSSSTAQKGSSWRTVNVPSGYLAIRTAPEADYDNEINHIGLKTGEQVQITGNYVQGTGFGGGTATYVWVYAPKFEVSGYVNAAYLN